jgi:hypothetical protein
MQICYLSQMDDMQKKAFISEIRPDRNFSTISILPTLLDWKIAGTVADDTRYFPER